MWDSGDVLLLRCARAACSAAGRCAVVGLCLWTPCDAAWNWWCRLLQACLQVLLAGADRCVGTCPPACTQYITPSFANNTLHFIGLLSDGGVHSRTDQL